MKRPSGVFVLRISPEIHQRLRDVAVRRGLSLNRLCTEILAQGVSIPEGRTQPSVEGTKNVLLHKLAERCQEVFGDDLLGVALFGSAARGEEFPDSDLDLLLVLDANCALRRGLYLRWAKEIEPFLEENVGREVNPHFCHLPDSPEAAGGLWLEVSIDGTVVWERRGEISRQLQALRAYLASGAARRHIRHGHPYWVREGDGRNGGDSA